MNLTKIIIYTTKTGRSPFSDWRDDLDTSTRAVIRARIERIRLGNFGDSKRIKNGGGIWEIRIDYGPGYRIYFGISKMIVLVLLLGGDKRSQDRDIAKAKKYWIECRELLDE